MTVVHGKTFMNNLPHTPMYWIDIPEHFNDMVVGTYGRGIWILDDITPLQQLPENSSSTSALLFKPKDAYRFQPVTSSMEFFKEASSGEDPPAGASINYWLSSDATDSVELKITNQTGDTVRTIKHMGKAGINRVWWNFTRDKTTPVVMQTRPQNAEWFALKPDGTRKAPLLLPWNTYSVVPGEYGIHLNANGQKFSERLTVIKDPNSEGSEEDISAQVDLLHKIYTDIDQVSVMINSLEKIRRQLKDLNKWIGEDQKELSLKVAEVEKAMTDLEHKLIQLNLTGQGQDGIRWPAKLMEKLAYLGFAVGTADFAPADQHIEVYNLLNAKLKEYQKESESLMSGTLSDLEKELESKSVKAIIR